MKNKHSILEYITDWFGPEILLGKIIEILVDIDEEDPDKSLAQYNEIYTYIKTFSQNLIFAGSSTHSFSFNYFIHDYREVCESSKKMLRLLYDGYFLRNKAYFEILNASIKLKIDELSTEDLIEGSTEEPSTEDPLEDSSTKDLPTADLPTEESPTEDSTEELPEDSLTEDSTEELPEDSLTEDSTEELPEDSPTEEPPTK